MGSSDWQKGPDTGVFGMRYCEDGEGDCQRYPLFQDCADRYFIEGPAGKRSGGVAGGGAESQERNAGTAPDHPYPTELTILKDPALLIIAVGLICIVLLAGCVSAPAGQTGRGPEREHDTRNHRDAGPQRSHPEIRCLCGTEFHPERGTGHGGGHREERHGRLPPVLWCEEYHDPGAGGSQTPASSSRRSRSPLPQQ